MNILREHLRINAALIAAGFPPRDYPRYIEGPWKHGNRAQRRANEAKVRQKADTPHGAQKRKPRNWKRSLKARRKASRTHL